VLAVMFRYTDNAVLLYIGALLDRPLLLCHSLSPVCRNRITGGCAFNRIACGESCASARPAKSLRELKRAQPGARTGSTSAPPESGSWMYERRRNRIPAASSECMIQKRSLGGRVSVLPEAVASAHLQKLLQLLGR
jgi:hypothetical protein